MLVEYVVISCECQLYIKDYFTLLYFTTAVKVNGRVSELFLVRVGVHQGSVLSLLLFIIVLEALSREFRGGLPMELLYADDLVLLADSMKELIEKVKR